MAQVSLNKLLLSKLLTGVLPIASLLVSVLVSPNSLAEAPLCQSTKVNDSQGASRVDLKIGSRRIAILGWTHLSASQAEEDMIAKLLLAAGNAAKRNECDSAAANLKELWTKQSDHVSPSLNLLGELKKVSTEFNPDVLGVEYSPEIWGTRHKNVQTQAEIVEFIADRCPSEAKGIAANIAIMFPGPEFLFEKSRGSTLRIEAIEDEGVRSQVLGISRQIAQLASLRTDDVKSEVRPLLESFMKRFSVGGPVNQTQIDEILKKQGSNETGVLVEKYLTLFKQMIDQNPPRNKRMADKILAGSGNYVIPIGNSHVSDLAKQLYERCQQGEGINALYYGPSNVSTGSDQAVFSAIR